MLKCDFCSSLAVRWVYPCDSFTMPPFRDAPTAGESIGAWAACNECHALIEAGDRGALTQRSLDTIPDVRGLPLNSVRKWMAELHRRFYQYRRGPARRHSGSLPM